MASGQPSSFIHREAQALRGSCTCPRTHYKPPSTLRTMSSQAPGQQCPLTQSAGQRWEKMATLSHPWSLSKNLQPLEWFLLSLCPAPLSRTGASATCSGCPRCLDKKVFKTGRMSFNIFITICKTRPSEQPRASPAAGERGSDRWSISAHIPSTVQLPGPG